MSVIWPKGLGDPDHQVLLGVQIVVVEDERHHAQLDDVHIDKCRPAPEARQYGGLRWLERMTPKTAKRIISTNKSYKEGPSGEAAASRVR